MQKTTLLFICFLVYNFQLCVGSSDFIANLLNHIRFEQQIQQSNTQKIQVTKTFWNAASDKDEILINGNYFDVVSFTTHPKHITLTVVADDFEMEFKSFFKNLMQRKGMLSHKKKSVIDFQHLMVIHKIELQNHWFIPEIHNFKFQNAFFSGITQRFFRPPCF